MTAQGREGRRGQNPMFPPVFPIPLCGAHDSRGFLAPDERHSISKLWDLMSPVQPSEQLSLNQVTEV